jgi:superfamily II DNA or RNA helicase
LFDTLIVSAQLSEFVKAGYLVKVRHIVGITPDLSSIKIKMNDYAQNELGELMQNESLMADLVESYQKKANGKKIIVFAVNIEHSKQIVENYRRAYIQAEHIDANTPKKEREQILQLFKEGRIKVLSNVDIVSEGFDVPDCEAVQLARPTKSLGLYLQQVGRCMRPAESKSEGIVLDNAGLWLEHGFCQQDRVWTLEGKKMRKRRKDNEVTVAAISQDEILRQASIPEEMKGMELIELTKEIKELFVFESYLSIALSNGHKPVSAYYRFSKYMKDENNNLTVIHLQYIQKRLSKLPGAPKEGMWYHEKKGRNLM